MEGTVARQHCMNFKNKEMENRKKQGQVRRGQKK
jgi:hypothetical protein